MQKDRKKERKKGSKATNNMYTCTLIGATLPISLSSDQTSTNQAILGDEQNGTAAEQVDGTGSHAPRTSRFQTQSHKETVNPVGKAG